MEWQDFVISAGQIVLFLALIPSVLSKDKPAFSTSLLTGSVLAVFAFTFVTLSMWFSGLSAGLVSVTWFLLAGQKYLSDR